MLVSAKVKGKDQTVNWTSDNNTIVVVDNGKITAVAPGTAIIRVTCGNLAKEINVNVKAKETNNMLTVKIQIIIKIMQIIVRVAGQVAIRLPIPHSIINIFLGFDCYIQ